MTLSEALKTLLNDASSSAAARDLQREVGAIAATTLRIFPELRDDFESRVVIKLLTRSPLPAIFERTPALATDDAPTLEPICRKYVKRMLFHLEIDELRRRERETRRRARADERDSIDPEEQRRQRMLVAIRDMIDEVRGLLDRVFDDAHESRTLEFRPHLKLAWDELWALAIEEKEMADVIRARAEEAPTATVTQLRNKALQAHRRLRLALGEAADRLEAANTLDPDEAALARSAIGLLLIRCHRRKK